MLPEGCFPHDSVPSAFVLTLSNWPPGRLKQNDSASHSAVPPDPNRHKCLIGDIVTSVCP